MQVAVHLGIEYGGKQKEVAASIVREQTLD